MDYEKRSGYALLASGLFLILVSLLAAFLVFSGAISPPRLFAIQKPEGTISIAGIELPAMDIVPVDYMNQSANLTFFLLFMFFAASVGGRISMLGIALLKDPKKKA